MKSGICGPESFWTQLSISRIPASHPPTPAEKGDLFLEDTPVKAGDVRDTGLIPGLGRYPGGDHGDPFQRSCLENPMDKELSRLQSYGHTESDMTAVTWHACMHSWRKDLESPRSCQGWPDSKQGLHADRPPSSDSAPRTWQPPGFSLFPGKSEEARRKDVEMLT